jgi:hypothetical protein
MIALAGAGFAAPCVLNTRSTKVLSRTLIVAAALAALAACDKPADNRAAGTSKAPDATSSAGASQTTPANLPQPATQDEKREGANPTQGQVDPKEGEQHRDFQQKGDSAGPTGPDTTPRNK